MHQTKRAATRRSPPAARRRRAIRPPARRAWTGVATLVFGLVLPLVVGGCATVSLDPVASRTSADERLQADIRRALGAYEAASGVDPQAPVIVRAVEPVDETGEAGGTKVERWTIDRSGTAVRYRVSMTPASGRGTQLQVEPEP